MDGGVTWANSAWSPTTGTPRVIDATSLGLRFKFPKRRPAPSFVAGNSWAFTTAASPDIIDIVATVEHDHRDRRRAADPDITAVPPHWTHARCLAGPMGAATARSACSGSG